MLTVVRVAVCRGIVDLNVFQDIFFSDCSTLKHHFIPPKNLRYLFNVLKTMLTDSLVAVEILTLKCQYKLKIP